MAKFAKLIEIDNNEQVLLTVNYNDETEEYETCIRTDFEGVVAQIKLIFKEEQMAIIAMEDYTRDQAIKFRNEMYHILFT